MGELHVSNTWPFYIHRLFRLNKLFKKWNLAERKYADKLFDGCVCLKRRPSAQNSHLNANQKKIHIVLVWLKWVFLIFLEITIALSVEYWKTSVARCHIASCANAASISTRAPVVCCPPKKVERLVGQHIDVDRAGLLVSRRRKKLPYVYDKHVCFTCRTMRANTRPSLVSQSASGVLPSGSLRVGPLLKCFVCAV